MKILITGGAGFIGAYLARALMDTGHRVTIIDKRTEYPNFKVNLLSGSDIYCLDVLESEKVFDQDFDCVIHLAARALEKPFDDPISRYQLTHDIELTYEVVSQAKKHKIEKFIYMSSLFAYGDFEFVATEDHLLNPVTPYGIMKAAGEQLVKSQCDNYEIIRTTSVYGYGDENYRATDILIDKARKNQTAWVNRDALLDFIYIKDLIPGIQEVVLHAAPNQEWHISGGHAQPLTKFADELKEIYPNFSYSQTNIHDRPGRGTLANDKARILLGWEPKYTLKTGIRDYLNYYEV